MARRNSLLRAGLCLLVVTLIAKVAVVVFTPPETRSIVQEWLADVERELATVEHVLVVVRPYLMQAVLTR